MTTENSPEKSPSKSASAKHTIRYMENSQQKQIFPIEANAFEKQFNLYKHIKNTDTQTQKVHKFTSC